MNLKTTAILMLATLLFTSCCKKCNDSDIVSERYVHKYGFDVSQKEWEEREKNGQIITVTKEGITTTASYKNGVLDGCVTITYPKSMKIREKLEYAEGSLVKRVFYELSGIPIQEIVYEHPTKRIITIWNKNGAPISMEEYDQDLLISARYYNAQNIVEATIVEGNGTRIKRDRI